MSDLISRSELIKELNKYCGNQRYLVSENIREIINNQPNSYSVDKVIEELKELHEIYLNRYGIIGNSSLGAIERAIEIVKHGGVGKDVD